MKKDEPLISVSEFYAVDIKQLWSALTDLDQKRLWFFENIPAFEAVVGFKTSFMVSSEERDFLHQWEVKEVRSLEKLVVEWTYKDYVGIANIIFDLAEAESCSCLTVSCVIVEDFTADIPEFKRESAMGGWTYFLKDRLKKHLT